MRTNKKEKIEKTYPQVGDQVYLRQFTGGYYIDMVKRPYTVISVDKNCVVVQKAKLIFPVFHYDPKVMTDYYKQFDGQRVCFFDTVAESIEPDPNGICERLSWHGKRGLWGTEGCPDSDYPEYMISGQGYQHQPYLD